MKRYRAYYKPRSVKRLEQKTRNKFIISLIFVIIFAYAFLTWGLPQIVGSLAFLNKSKISNTENPAEDPALPPPVLNIPYEATNSADFIINGYTTPNSEVEIYLDNQLKTKTRANGGGEFTATIQLSEGINNIYGITLQKDPDDSSDKKSLPSKTIKLQFSDEKPVLEVSQPQDNQEIKGGDKKITVSGKTDSQNSVSVNGLTAVVNNEGVFQTVVPLNDGENLITIISQNPVGNTTKVEKKVIYTP